MCDEGSHGHVHSRHGHGQKGMAFCFPFSPQQMQKMKTMAKHFMRGFMGSHIPYNVEDLGDSYLITVPLAGRTKEEVKVSLINKHLNIKAEKPKIPELEKVEKKPEEGDVGEFCCGPSFWKGFTFIDVDMDITLPVDADTDTIVSKMANGLLKVTFSKKPAKKIDISES
ncbi:MAG: Hsp20/alpha crystallin family protein [Promethearchaeota archaeon]|nr:MAG: Hsp20/alpha crystallin family protein [Candidatus Lokiarchaeota archaeon]